MHNARKAGCGGALTLILGLLIGCGPGQGTSFTVNGIVVDPFGNPAPGVVVVINDLPPTASSGDGSFSVAGVSAPYDLVALSGLGDAAHVFSGLSTASPRINPRFVSATASRHEARISGSKTGDTLPGAPSQYVLVCVEGLNRVVFGCGTGSSDTSLNLGVVWYGPSSTEVRVRAFQYEFEWGQGRLVTPISYGEATTTVTSGVTVDVDIVLGSPPPVGTIAIEATAPLELPAGNWYGLAAVNTSPLHTFYIWSPTSEGGTNQPRFPALPGASYTATVLWEVADTAADKAFVWRTGLTEGASVTLDIPVPPTIAAPADGATGVSHSTPIVVTGLPGSLLFEFRSFEPSLSIYVSTMEKAISLPDLSHLGFSIPSQTRFWWTAITFPKTQTADQMVAGRGQYMRPYLVHGWEGTPFEEDGAYAFSGGRTFTTK